MAQAATWQAPCGTAMHLDLSLPRPLLSPPGFPPPSSQKGNRDAIGEYPHEQSSENFVMKWGNNGNVDSDDVTQILQAFEQSWDYEIETLNLPAPQGSEEWLFNIYIADTGSQTPAGGGFAGYYSQDSDGWPLIVVTQDVVATYSSWGAATAAHEFFHAVQAATGAFWTTEGYWWWEATASWVEPYAIVGDTTYPVFLFGYAFLPHYPLFFYKYPEEGVIQEYHQYGAFIFARYLSEKVADTEIVAATWREGSQGGDPIDDLQGLLGEEADIGEIFADFAAHNTVWDYAHGSLYQEAMEYGESWFPDDDYRLAAIVDDEGTDGWVDAPEETLPGPFGTNVIRMRWPDAGVLHVGFEGEGIGSSNARAAWAVRLVRQRVTADPIYLELEVEDDSATAEVELDGEDVAIMLVVSVVPGNRHWGEEFGYRYSLDLEADPGEDPPNSGEVESETLAAGCACATGPRRKLPWTGLLLVACVFGRRRRGLHWRCLSGQVS